MRTNFKKLIADARARKKDNDRQNQQTRLRERAEEDRKDREAAERVLKELAAKIKHAGMDGKTSVLVLGVGNDTQVGGLTGVAAHVVEELTKQGLYDKLRVDIDVSGAPSHNNHLILDLT